MTSPAPTPPPAPAPSREAITKELARKITTRLAHIPTSELADANLPKIEKEFSKLIGQYLAARLDVLERENTQLRMELDASCNAEELRQLRARLTKAEADLAAMRTQQAAVQPPLSGAVRMKELMELADIVGLMSGTISGARYNLKNDTPRHVLESMSEAAQKVKRASEIIDLFLAPQPGKGPSNAELTTRLQEREAEVGRLAQGHSDVAFALATPFSDAIKAFTIAHRLASEFIKPPPALNPPPKEST